MYPAKFEYFAPTSLDEALELLGRYDEGEAKVLAGGMSLLSVAVAGAQHTNTLEHDGTTYYFCGPGCLRKLQAALV